MNKKRSTLIESSNNYERRLFRMSLLGNHMFKEKKNQFKDDTIAMQLINEKETSIIEGKVLL